MLRQLHAHPVVDELMPRSLAGNLPVAACRCRTPPRLKGRAISLTDTASLFWFGTSDRVQPPAQRASAGVS